MASDSKKLRIDLTAGEIGEQARSGAISESEALARLVALGFIEADAREQIYIALGGDDVVLE